MKKILLIVSLFTLISFTKVNAQVLNSSFENWVTDTAYFDGFGFFPKDTFQFTDPVDWTTTNALSGADTFGAKILVTKTANSYSGNWAMELTTDTFKTVGTPLGPRKLTIPGLALNGTFPLNLAGSLALGGTISPSQIPGAGQPFTKRLANFKGWYDYAPVYNDSTHATDSCMVWVTLKKGSEIVADAIFKSADTTNGYMPFSAPFVYSSCSIPDTMVILVAASVPNFGSLIAGTTKLVRGSVLRLDVLGYDTLAAGFAFPPIARDDTGTTFKNTAKAFSVKLNDDDCDNPGLAGETVTVATTALYGTTSALAGVITYTPTLGFTGLDSFTYTLSDGAHSSTAKVKVTVVVNTGISEANEIPVQIYPVPASNQLTVNFENTGKSTLQVFDIVGHLVLSSNLTNNSNTISIANLPNGIYGLQIANETNAVIARK